MLGFSILLFVGSLAMVFFFFSGELRWLCFSCLASVWSGCLCCCRCLFGSVSRLGGVWVLGLGHFSFPFFSFGTYHFGWHLAFLFVKISDGVCCCALNPSSLCIPFLKINEFLLPSKKYLCPGYCYVPRDDNAEV